MPALLRRAIEVGAQCWTATQVELQGQYSVQHVREFAAYYKKTSVWRALFVCVITLVPCILCVTLIDFLPLEPLSAGAIGSPKLWVRTFMSTLVMTASTLEHFRQHVDGMRLGAWTVLLLTVVVSVITILLTIALAIGIGYPIPFGLIVGTLPWFVTLLAGLLCVKRRQLCAGTPLLKNTLRYMLVCTCQITITLFYPLFNYVFVTLSPTQQTGFVLVLPVLKIMAKNWIYYALLDWDDGKPEAVVFNIEIFHSLYVAFCMQSATSMRTVFVLMGVDVVQSWLSFHDVQTLLAALQPLAVKMDSARRRTSSVDSRSRTALLDLVELACRVVEVEPHLAVGLDEQHRQRVRSRASRLGLIASVRADIGGLFPHANGLPTLLADPKIAPSQEDRAAGPTRSDTCIVSSTSSKPSRGPAPVALSSAVGPMPALPTLPSDLAALAAVERGILVRVVQQLLFITEFVVLIEYVEVIMPVVYNILVGVLLALPNHEYYPFLRSLSIDDFLPTITNVMMYASLEFLSLVALAVLVWWKLRLSLLHQLAFVLEGRQLSVQSKLVIWVIYVMQCSIDHFGADYSFRFEWLHQLKPPASSIDLRAMVATAWCALRRSAAGASRRLRPTLLQRHARSMTLPAARALSDDASVPTTSITPHPRPTIALTAAESSLFDFLLYVQHLHAPSTQLRVAGGWVRDKLRGAESEDIDIVLDNIYGKEFANHIVKFQRQRRLPLSSVGVVKANSDKSKHLEVAQVKVDGHMVDFVHLRSEAYTEDSRVPDATFAVPAEDALRRDITINALFYNLHTREVEDFTGRGLDDLSSGIVRTPLEPHQTFLDDPLRVLRVIRFACEFGFSLDPSIVDTVLTNGDIRDAMKRKVSRERVGIEVKKMLSGSNPSRAFELLAQFGLLDIVFHHAGGDSTDDRLDARALALRTLFTWTPELIARGEHHVRHVQHARLAMDKHKISFMEATAAALAPFILPPQYAQTLQPALETVLEAATSGSDAHWLPHVDETMLIDTALAYRASCDRAMAAFPREDLIELLKHNVKWSKPAAKRVTHILEAVLAFPSALDAQRVAENHVQLFLWSMKFHDVLSPAIATLLTEIGHNNKGDDDHDKREQLVAALDAIAMRFTQQPPQATPSGRGDQEVKRVTRRVDGRLIRERLGGDVGPQIGVALEVLAAYEFVYPSASLDQELAFLDRLYPLLK